MHRKYFTAVVRLCTSATKETWLIQEGESEWRKWPTQVIMLNLNKGK